MTLTPLILDGAFNVDVSLGSETGTVGGWVSIDGNALIGGEIMVEDRRPTEDGIKYSLGTRAGGKTDSAMDLSSLNGTYHLFSRDSHFWEYPGGVIDYEWGADVIMTFDGNGGCTGSHTGREFGSDGNTVITPGPESGEFATCTYTVTPDGIFSASLNDGTDTTVEGWVNAVGNLIVSGGVEMEDRRPAEDGTHYSVGMMTGVKVN